MKILFITTGDIKSVATMKRAIGMASPLHALGWEVGIIAQDTEENKKRIELETNNNAQVFFYIKKSVKEEIAFKTRTVNGWKPDYIYFCSFSFRNKINKHKLKFLPKIIIEHSELASHININKGLRKWALSFIEYWSVFYADKLVCASKFLTQFYTKRAKKLFKPRYPILYSPYAYSNEVINAPLLLINDLKKRYDGKKILLYMGTMTKNYGLMTMLNAVKIVKKTNDTVKLLMLGKGRHLEEGKKFVVENKLEDQVEFLGYVEETDLSSYFTIADAFVSPLNNTIQDIARCPSKIYMYLPFKKPIFTCAIGEPKEIFEENGYYFDNDDPATLASLIQQLINNSIQTKTINIKEHSWNKRSKDFDTWIQQN